jgi:hypothetical protein
MAVEFSQNPPIDSDGVELGQQIKYYNEKVFGKFLLLAFNFKLHEIKRAVQYASRFFALNL